MDWHLLSENEVIEKLGSDKEKGLDRGKVHKRLQEFGNNRLKKVSHFNALKVFLEQFKSFLIIILILAAVFSFFIESKIDSVVIFAIIILNAGLGFFQEYKASKAIEDLNKMMVLKSKILREGRIFEINSEDVVPGDILILGEGDKVCADARVIKSNGLNIDESILTGESIAQEKISEKLDSSVLVADRINMIYQGTVIVSGSGRAVVVDTGMKTELGKISELVQEIEPEKNPFKDKLDRFAKKVGIFILILSALIVILLVLNGIDTFNSFLVAISLAVSAIPEGLPAVVSLGLAFATRRMAGKNVLIRKLPASETLGRVTVICVDKTGTLTEGKMEVSSIYTNGKINPAKEKDMLFKIGVLCNKARIEKEENEEYFIGDPTEIALIISAKNNFIDKKEMAEKYPKFKEFVFTSERKMMSIVRRDGRKLVSYVKGAPEKIIERCSYEIVEGRKIKLMDKDRERLLGIYEKMAGEGLRVLGFAYKDLGYEIGEGITEKVAEHGLVFVGFQGMIDPPRKNVKNAVELCEQAGIKVIMLTGDSKLTADAVAKEIGLKGNSVDVSSLEGISDKELIENIKYISVFSRISPQDKLRIINILKQKNEIVAMTGDGVNDALALKRADIGIAMGIRGTEVARDSSDIVLADDNFSSIVEGVKEGRTIYDNSKKFIKFLLSSNFSEVALVLLVMLIWRNPELLPLLPLQILWINLVTDSLPALALSAEPMEDDVMKRKPSRSGILNGIKGFIIFAGLLILLGEILFFYYNIDNVEKARTIVVTTSVIFQMFLVFNCKSDKLVFKTKSNKYLFYAVGISIAAHLIVLYTPLNSLFYFVPLGFIEWIGIIGFCIAGFLVIEGWKYYLDKKYF